jgi:hypothetical protein
METAMQTNAMAVLAAAILIAASTTESVGAPQARYLDSITGDAEKDSFGYVDADFVLQPRAAVLFSPVSQYVGARMGTDEKDTFARIEVKPTLAADLGK